MTERIEQITKQTDEYFDDLSIEFSRQVWMEKFAELIVQECTDLVQKYMTRWPEDCELTKQIKEHFGVDK